MDHDRTIAFLDLYAEEPVLGDASRFVREAGVRFGRPTVGPVADDELPELDRRRPDLGKWRFTAVTLPFDLEDLPSGRRYVSATVRMTFDDPDVRSLALSRPSAAGAAEDTDMATWGVGREELKWKLTARSGTRGIRPSGRCVLAVLESPLGHDRLMGALEAEVWLVTRMLGVSVQSVAGPKKPLRFSLNVADGEFEVAAAQ